MDEEATQIIKLLNLKPTEAPDKSLPMKAYSGSYDKLNIYLILNGTDPAYKVENIGSQPATLSTYLGIKEFHPDLIMNIGTAGGFSRKHANVGDVYISNKISFYDRRLHSPDYKLYGKGNYSSPNTQNMAKTLKFKTGTICSGDSFEDDQTDLKVLAEQKCSVKEMEAAGVAWVAMLTKTPMFALKGITDQVGHVSNHDQFEKNFSRVNKEIAIKTRSILKYLSNDKTEGTY